MRFMKQIRTRKENCMKIALVEDNGLHQAQIRQEIQNYFDELNEVCELHVFDNGSEIRWPVVMVTRVSFQEYSLLKICHSFQMAVLLTSCLIHGVCLLE